MTMQVYKRPDGPLTFATLIANAAALGQQELVTGDAMLFCSSLSELEFMRFRTAIKAARTYEPPGWAKLISDKRAERERTKKQKPNEPWRNDLRIRDGRVCASARNLQIVLTHSYGSRLRFDEMGAKPSLDGQPLKDEDVAMLQCELEKDEDIEFTEAQIRTAIALVARSNAYHPVRDYLSGLKWDGKKRLADMAAEYLGATDPLSAKLVGRTMIAAVARVFDPGCKVDTCLVLVGDEGLKKSTFFRVLGGAWFKDSKVDITDRKGMMLMHSAWIYEWPEVDRMLEKKHDSDVKAYISQTSDSYVPMYGRSVEDFSRSNICVGTTNKEKFVTSHTGSRRWWIVSVTKRIDIDRLEAERDQLFAEAAHLYHRFVASQKTALRGDANPYRWWLDETEEAARAGRNEEHLMQSPDVERVEAWLAGDAVQCAGCKGTGNGFGDKPCPVCAGSKVTRRGEPRRNSEGREYVTCSEILDVLAVSTERHEASAYRAVNVLRRLEWRNGRRIRSRDGGPAQVTPYYAPLPVATAPPRPPDPAEEFDR